MGTRAFVVIGLAVAALAGFLLWSGKPDPASLTDSEEEDRAKQTPDLLTAGGRDDPGLVGRGSRSKHESAETTERAKRAVDTRPEDRRPGPDRVVGRVLSPDGKPMSGVVLTVKSLRREEDEPIETHGAVSDEQGLFTIPNVGKGAYHVSAWIKGHGRSTVSTTAGGDIELTLHPLSFLAGVVVERGTDQAIAGMLIVARPSLSPTAGQPYATHTGTDGRFRLEVPGHASYVVQIGQGYGQGATEVAAFVRGRAGPFDAGRDDLRLEAQRGLDIAGEIRREDGTLVTPPMSVVALAVTPDGNPDYGNRRYVRSSAGAFRLRGLPPGRYTLTFEPPPPKAGDEAGHLATRTLDGIEAGTENLQVVLSAGQVIAGTLVDEEGNPVTGQGMVFIKPHGTVTGGQEMVYARLDGKGGFRSPPLDPATPHELTANGFKGYMQTDLERVFAGPDLVKVVLRKGSFIAGRVVDEEGKPVPPGVGIMATAVDGKPGEKGTFMFGYTGAGGAFRLEGVGPHTFRVIAGGASSAFVAAAAPQTVKANESAIVLKVRRGVTLSGRLVDTAGEPVKTHNLSARSLAPDAGPQSWTRVENEEGRFRFPGVPKGKVQLAATIGKEYVVLGEFEAPAEDLVVTIPDPDDRRRRRKVSAR